MEQKQRILHNLKILGFETDGSFEDCVELLIEQHLLMMQEIEQDNKEFFKKELKRILKPTN